MTEQKTAAAPKSADEQPETDKTRPESKPIIPQQRLKKYDACLFSPVFPAECILYIHYQNTDECSFSRYVLIHKALCLQNQSSL